MSGPKHTPTVLSGPCPACEGRGYDYESGDWSMDQPVQVACPDCAGTGKAENSITANEKPRRSRQVEGAQPVSGPKHTPAPWRITNYGGVFWIHSGDVVNNALGLLGKAAEEADARLIAAAPRLAAALKDALSGLEVARQHYGMNTGLLEDTARAALREAGMES